MIKMMRCVQTRTFIRYSLGFMVAVVSGPSLTAEPLSSSSFGVVNSQQVILSVPEGIRARKALEEEVAARQKELLQKRKELEALGKEWEQKSALLSDKAKQQKAVELQSKMAALREGELKLQQDMREKEAEATREILVKINKQVKILAEKKKLFAVFDSSRAAIVYMRDYVDITDDVILAFSESKPSSPSDKKAVAQ